MIKHFKTEKLIFCKICEKNFLKSFGKVTFAKGLLFTVTLLFDWLDLKKGLIFTVTLLKGFPKNN